MNELNTSRFMRGGGQEYSGVLGEKKMGIKVDEREWICEGGDEG